MSRILQFIRENHILALIEGAIDSKKLRLNLNGFSIIELPGLLFTCYDIEQLFLHRNKIYRLPAQISDMTNLTTLTLDYNNLTALPSEIGNLKNLINLNISSNPLNVLIPEIGDLENLEAFWCNKIGLREIPKEIGKLSKLDTFGARGNELTELPDEFTNLTKLRWLTLEKNQISKLPESMSRMEALVHVNFNYNSFTEFPMVLLECHDLMYVKFVHNQLTALPEEFDIGKLPALEVIDIRDNPICNISPEPINPIIKLNDSPASAEPLSARLHTAQALVVNATALRLPAVPAAELVLPRPLEQEMFEDDGDASTSEDWENSMNSSEIDVHYHSDEDINENEAVGMGLPELSRYASIAS